MRFLLLHTAKHCSDLFFVISVQKIIISSKCAQELWRHNFIASLVLLLNWSEACFNSAIRLLTSRHPATSLLEDGRSVQESTLPCFPLSVFEVRTAVAGPE